MTDQSLPRLSKIYLSQLFYSALFLSAISLQQATAQTPQASDATVFHSETNLVFLDVTVLDKKNKPVTTGLTKDDFTIIEDKTPQPIFSFEAPEAHAFNKKSEEDNPDGKVPVTIFVLDLLNSDFQDASYLREHFAKYLAAQPSQLPAPAELMVIGNNSLEMIQSYTRSRDQLLSALVHLHASVPFKRNTSDFIIERVQQSIESLQQIVLQNKGVPGRKNLIWIGHGAPTLDTAASAGGKLTQIKQYLHETANMMVDARVTLYVIYPPTRLEKRSDFFAPTIGSADFAGRDPFGADVSFVDFVRETGGQLFYNRNDIDDEIKESETLGSKYYTLTYSPHKLASDGRFKAIHIAMRNPDLHAVTKNGYFAPDNSVAADPRHKAVLTLGQAALSQIPLTALDLKILKVVKFPEFGTAVLTVQVNTKNLDWHKDEDGKSSTNLYVASATMNDHKRMLASMFGKVTGVLRTQDPTVLAAADCEFTVTVRVPEKTREVRLMMETEDAGRIGTVDISRNTIDAAPARQAPATPPAAQPSGAPGSH